MSVRPGDSCSLTYDTNEEPEPGDWIETGSGRRYLIDGVRLVGNRGRRPTGYTHRWKLDVIVMAFDDLEPTGRRFELHWYQR